MDLLKKVLENPGDCVIEGKRVTIAGKECNGDEIVNFPSKKSKEYSLRAVAFFLLNSESPLKDYLSLCKGKDIPPVSHVDKATIISDVNSYTTEEIKGFFIEPELVKRSAHGSNMCCYEIPTGGNRDIIVVPGSLLATIHIDNVERLLTEGVLDQKGVNPLSTDRKEIEILKNGRKLSFTVARDSEKFTNDEWKRVIAVFIEDLDEKEAQDILGHCGNDVSVFTLKKERIRSVPLEISDGKLKNHDEVLKKLEE